MTHLLTSLRGYQLPARTFKELLVYGQDGERVVGRWLKSQNVPHLALHQFTAAQAPKVSTAMGGLTAPDFTCWTATGACFFVECKRQRGNITNEGPAIVHEASVQERHFNDYRTLVQTTRCRLEILFLMAAHDRAPERGGLYRVDLATEPDRFWDGIAPDGSRHGPQFFYRLQPEQRIATLEALAVLPQ